MQHYKKLRWKNWQFDISISFERKSLIIFNDLGTISLLKAFPDQNFLPYAIYDVRARTEFCSPCSVGSVVTKFSNIQYERLKY